MEARRRGFAALLCGIILATWGCASSAAVQAKISALQENHGVAVIVGNPLSRCYLFGNLPALLDRIDAQLALTPAYFKKHLGPIVIEESFLDNPRALPFPFLIRGYVDPQEADLGFPIHIKNRSFLEKVVFFAPRNDELFLHEATHSFEMHVRRENRQRWESFLSEFRLAQSGDSPYGNLHFKLAGYGLALSLMPPLGYVRPEGMPSLYGSLGHYEDVAETHCYLQRNKEHLEALARTDPVLLRKCRVVERFVGGAASGPSGGP